MNLSCREEAALSRLNDSDKMWAMLKRIAQQECAESASPAADSVILRFLSLAPRVTSLNAAVKAALCDPLMPTTSMQGAMPSKQRCMIWVKVECCMMWIKLECCMMWTKLEYCMMWANLEYC